MMPKPPPRQPPTPDPETAGISSPAEENGESAVSEQAEAEERQDPYDDLWDPDMDTRPERIKRTKARSRGDVRARGRGAPRGKRRTEA